MKKNKSNMERFIDHLYTPDVLENTKDIQDELLANGIDSKIILDKVNGLFARSTVAEKPKWLDSARKRYSNIEKIFSERSNDLRNKYPSPKALVEAIKTGEFGAGYQARANAFFRNQDFSELSDDDLTSFIEDCNLLDALNNVGEKKK